MPGKFLEVDILVVDGDRENNQWVGRLQDVLREYQSKHGAIPLDHLDFQELKHPMETGMRMMMIIRKQGDRIAPDAQPSGGGKKKGDN